MINQQLRIQYVYIVTMIYDIVQVNLHWQAMAISSIAAINTPGESTSAPTSSTAAAIWIPSTLPKTLSSLAAPLQQTFGPLLHWDKQPDASIMTELSFSPTGIPVPVLGMRSLRVCTSPPSYLDGKLLTQPLFWQTCIFVGFKAKAPQHVVEINERRTKLVLLLERNTIVCFIFSFCVIYEWTAVAGSGCCKWLCDVWCLISLKISKSVLCLFASFLLSPFSFSLSSGAIVLFVIWGNSSLCHLRQ